MPGQKVLLVEGRDDEHVMFHICNQHEVSCPEVTACEDDSQLLPGQDKLH